VEALAQVKIEMVAQEVLAVVQELREHLAMLAALQLQIRVTLAAAFKSLMVTILALVAVVELPL
jgi:hypothetical protein